MIAARPDSAPRLWRAYLDRAREVYQQFGIGKVLEYSTTKSGHSSALFFVILDDRGQVVGGSRGQGPYRSVEQAHILREWNGREGSAEIRQEIASRLEHGVVEMKTGWVDPHHPHRHELGSIVARTPVHASRLLGVRYTFCSLGSHAAPRWITTGGVISETVPPVAYPDQRYLTMMMWWDLENYRSTAQPEQVQAMLEEERQMDEFAHEDPMA